MTGWYAAPLRDFCGGCGEPIAKGDPVFVFTIARLKRQLVRCQTCTGSTPTGPLPPKPTARVLSFVRFTPELVPVDWKTLQAGAERDPGEDG
jgi:hypothetical protein